MFKKTCIIGCGLIGSSLARAIKKNNLSNKIVSSNRSDAVNKKIIELNIVDDSSSDTKKMADDSDLIIIATPLSSYESVILKIKDSLKDGTILTGSDALKYSIKCGIDSGKYVTNNILSKPQDLEYEKTFYPFILISKKRYTGDKYELDHKKPKERTSMGIVMKRRDNAAIVKYVFGNVIEIIMNQKI